MIHAARVPLEQREDYQAGLRASQLNLHDVAALNLSACSRQRISAAPRSRD
jgi:hypothetical protein